MELVSGRIGGLVFPATLLAVPALAAAGEASGAAPGPTLGVSDGVFYLFAAITVVCCLGVVLSANIVRCAMWLLGVLGAVACLYFLLEANFLGAIQLIVYAGGILVLIVFGIMLTSQSPHIRLRPRRGEVIGGAVVGAALLAVLVYVMVSASWSGGEASGAVPVALLGKALLTTYLAPFEAASVLLLVVMIGAAYLVRSEK